MALTITIMLIVAASFTAGVLVERKNSLVARAQAGEQAALDAIKSKLKLQ